MGGPIWNQKIHDPVFVKRLLESTRNQDNKVQKEGKVFEKEIKDGDPLRMGTTNRITAVLTSIIDEDVIAL